MLRAEDRERQSVFVQLVDRLNMGPPGLTVEPVCHPRGAVPDEVNGEDRYKLEWSLENVDEENVSYVLESLDRTSRLRRFEPEFAREITDVMSYQFMRQVWDDPRCNIAPANWGRLEQNYMPTLLRAEQILSGPRHG